MKHALFLFAMIMLLSGKSHAQSDTASVYKNLETKKFYAVGLFSKAINGKGTYEVNGKKVSKSVYDKYHDTRENMEGCLPCILKTYNENDVLIREAVAYTDCGIGRFKKFYPNGNIKLSGRYKENPTNNWKDVDERGYCNVAEGQWVYFDEKGDTLYSEFWKDDQFIKQVPEQKSRDLESGIAAGWKTNRKRTLNAGTGEKTGSQTLLQKQFN